jgi:hypothetical protein
MRARALFAFALMISITSLIRPSYACSICGCDPSGGTLGLERPSPGDLRLTIEGRYLQKESGADTAAEGEKEGRSVLKVQYSPVKRLSFGFELPYYLWKNHYDNSGTMDENARGVSDIQLGARYELLQIGGMVARHSLAVSYSLKAPTGNNTFVAPVDVVNGQINYDEHKQLGTGTWDHIVGLWYAYGDFPWVAYAGIQARINGTNSRSFQYGNALFGTVGVRRSFLQDRSLYFSLEAQARNNGKDRGVDSDGTPTTDPDSGGFLSYATIGAGYQITMNLLVRGVLQIPTVKSLNGTQSEHPVGFLGLAYDLSL